MLNVCLSHRVRHPLDVLLHTISGKAGEVHPMIKEMGRKATMARCARMWQDESCPVLYTTVPMCSVGR